MSQLSPWTAPPPLSAEMREERSVWSWPDEVRAGLVTVLVLVLVAGPIGLIWGHVAPRAALLVIVEGAESIGGHPAHPDSVSAESLIATDAYFVIITGITGVVSGAVAWLLARRTGVGVVVGLAVGGVLAAFCAIEVGRLVIHEAVDPTIAQLSLPPREHARYHFGPLWHGSVAVWAFAAVVTYAVLVALLDDRRARRHG